MAASFLSDPDRCNLAAGMMQSLAAQALAFRFFIAEGKVCNLGRLERLILCVLFRSARPYSAAEIARALGVRRQDVTDPLQRLQEECLVARAVNGRGRPHMIVATDKGHQYALAGVFASLQASHPEHSEQFEKRIGIIKTYLEAAGARLSHEGVRGAGGRVRTA